MNLKLHLAPVTRTDVLCLACNKFGAQQAVVLSDGFVTEMGIHTACVASVHVKQQRAAK